MEPLREDEFDCPFPDEIKAKGQALFDAGDIRLRERRDDEPYEARVPFFRRTRDVAVERLKNGQVSYDCTCPHNVNTGEGCEHLWGLILAVNASLSPEVVAEDAPPLTPYFVVARGVGPLRVDLAERTPDGLELRVADGATLARVTDERDRKAVASLAQAAGGRISLIEGGGFAQKKGPWPIPDDLVDLVLARLLTSGRMVLEGDTQLRPLHGEPGPPMDLALRFEPDPERDGRLLARGWLVPTEGKPHRLEKVQAVFTGARPRALHAGRLHPLRTYGAADWIKLLAGKPIVIQERELPDFLRRLAASTPLPRLWALGDASAAPLGAATPVGRLAVSHRPEGMRGILSFLYGGKELSELGAERLILDLETGRQGRRNPAAEAQIAARIESGPARRDPDIAGAFLLTPSKAELFCAQLAEEGMSVLIEDRALKRRGPSSVRIVEKGDAYELVGTLDFDGEAIPVERVLGAFRAGKRFLELDGGRGCIPMEWTAALDRLAQLADDGKHLRFSRSQALLAEAWVADERGRPDASRLGKALEELARPPRRRAPKDLAATLRGYQEEGVAWLRSLAQHEVGGCLADDMGLGKTVQIIALLLALREKNPGTPALVVAPRSLIWNWQSELIRFAPTLRVLVYDGPRRKELLAEFEDHDVVLTTYGLIRRDAERLAPISFDAIALDEAHAIKNPDSQIFAAVRRLQGRVRVAVTGTPVENRLRDFWSLMEFLNPGLLGSERRFTQAMNSQGGQDGRSLLHRLVRPLVLRRTKAEVAPELPPRIEQTILCPLLPEQKRLYAQIAGELRESLERKATPDGLVRERPQVLEALLRLRQAACHPRLVPGAERGLDSGKLSVLMDSLEQILDSGHQALVFSQFTGFLDLVSEALTARDVEHAVLTGATRDRQVPVKRFQEDGCPILLVSLKAGGVGLNLTAADYVFLLDPWWNPAAEAQAIDRAHRIGREDPVVAYRLVTKGTIEEKIRELQTQKIELARNLLDAPEGVIPSLSREDLAYLLG